MFGRTGKHKAERQAKRQAKRLLPQLDEPPKDGVWREHGELGLSQEEVNEGNRQGVEIDPDNDGDNGL